METTSHAYFTRRIGSTTYKVKVCFSEEADETFEDKMIRLIASQVITLEGTIPREENNDGGAA